MEYRSLGRSGLKVSVVGVGCNNFGRQVDAETTPNIVSAALDCGINFFDTADSYGNRGGSEEALGAALKGRRQDVILATKGGARIGDGPNDWGGSRKNLVAALDNSLRRLQTDYIDLYQLHRPDRTTPIEETMRAMDDLVRSGKVRYIGCSNFTSWELVEANLKADARHLIGFSSAQNQYSLLKRDVESELGRVCMKFGVGMLPYFPLASGLLTGKYRRDEAPPQGTRLSGEYEVYKTMLDAANFETIYQLDSFARGRGHTLVELAMSWLASRPFISSVIAGVTNVEQVMENARAWQWKLTEDELAEIDEITPPPFDGSGDILDDVTAYERQRRQKP